jgi:DNA-binding transcriptional LysR family regulator
LERGEIDAYICGRVPLTPRTQRTALFMERYVGVRDAARTPNDAPIDTDAYVNFPQALFESARLSVSTWDQRVVTPKGGAAAGMTHRVALTMPHIVAIPFAVAGTDLLGIVAERIAKRFAAAAGVSIVSLPHDMPLSIDLMVARNRSSDTALRWLVDLIIRETSDL